MAWLINRQKVWLLKIVIHFSALIPLVMVYYQAIYGQDFADPVKAVIHFTGIGSFNLLLITLLISPLAAYFKQGYLLQVRRVLGLYSYFYALAHLINFIAFDLQFNFALLLNEIIKRPYITLGMVAFLLLTLLAITSLDFLKRKLGRRWQKLHNSVYAVVIVVGIHFYWSVKSEIITPSIYLLMAIFLLALRYKKIKAILQSLFKISFTSK
jgi:sulfoxide reductase heme-binding subunit YedZ